MRPTLGEKCGLVLQGKCQKERDSLEIRNWMASDAEQPSTSPRKSLALITEPVSGSRESVKTQPKRFFTDHRQIRNSLMLGRIAVEGVAAIVIGQMVDQVVNAAGEFVDLGWGNRGGPAGQTRPVAGLQGPRHF